MASSGDAPQKEKQGLAEQHVDHLFDLLARNRKTLLVLLEVMYMLRPHAPKDSGKSLDRSQAYSVTGEFDRIVLVGACGV
ncbi:hypothetical protein [Ktedonobacter sp. SOSP1-52]|uniref:hypothetical protein n=1 Tax=Ktedonobacter sp. SOSP1-52 TaxID=2778366 RepID=UPI001914EB8F|nr:hypothetical protein [Ktedonobacter sp. SOSP1-52]